jgi:hypothetical protein
MSIKGKLLVQVMEINAVLASEEKPVIWRHRGSRPSFRSGSYYEANLHVLYWTDTNSYIYRQGDKTYDRDSFVELMNEYPAQLKGLPG